MTVDERIASLETSVANLKGSTKDIWDKLPALAAILVPISIAIVGHQFATNMKDAELNAQQRQAQDQLALSKATAEQDQAIAKINARVSQVGIVSHLLDALTGNDAAKQRVAIRAVLIALPEDGPALVDGLTAPSTNAATRSIAVTALQERVRPLVANLFHPAPGMREKAYAELTSPVWRTNTEIIDALLSHARSNPANDDGIYNTVVVLKNISRTITQPRKSDINAFCQEIQTGRPRITEQCRSLAAWLETRR
jgi:hypothetical protein